MTLPLSNKPLFVAVEKSTHNSILLIHHKSLQDNVKDYASNLKRNLAEIFKEEDLEHTIYPTKTPPQIPDTATTPYKTYLMAANSQDEFKTSNFPPIPPQSTQKSPPSPPRNNRNTPQQTPQNNQTVQQNQSAWTTPLQHTPNLYL